MGPDWKGPTKPGFEEKSHESIPTAMLGALILVWYTSSLASNTISKVCVVPDGLGPAFSVLTAFPHRSY
jgi:hypothetical protein